MTLPVVPKSSAEPGMAPLPDELKPAELALNSGDRRLYARMADGSVRLVRAEGESRDRGTFEGGCDLGCGCQPPPDNPLPPLPPVEPPVPPECEGGKPAAAKNLRVTCVGVNQGYAEPGFLLEWDADPLGCSPTAYTLIERAISVDSQTRWWGYATVTTLGSGSSGGITGLYANGDEKRVFVACDQEMAFLGPEISVYTPLNNWRVRPVGLNGVEGNVATLENGPVCCTGGPPPDYGAYVLGTTQETTWQCLDQNGAIASSGSGTCGLYTFNAKYAEWRLGVAPDGVTAFATLQGAQAAVAAANASRPATSFQTQEACQIACENARFACYLAFGTTPTCVAADIDEVNQQLALGNSIFPTPEECATRCGQPACQNLPAGWSCDPHNGHMGYGLNDTTQAVASGLYSTWLSNVYAIARWLADHHYVNARVWWEGKPGQLPPRIESGTDVSSVTVDGQQYWRYWNIRAECHGQVGTGVDSHISTPGLPAGTATVNLSPCIPYNNPAP